MKEEDIRELYERIHSRKRVSHGRLTKSGMELTEYINAIMSATGLEEVPSTDVAIFVAEATGRDVNSVKGSLNSFLSSDAGAERFVIGKNGRLNVIRKKEEEA
jgi:hypothetical protein